MKKQSSTPIRKYFLPRFVLPALCLWLLSMGFLTLAVAKDFYRQLETAAEHRVQAARNVCAQTEYLGSLEYAIFTDVSRNSMYFDSIEPYLPIVRPQHDGVVNSDDPEWSNWELFLGCQAAIGFYDAQGQKLLASGDYLAFHYRERSPGDAFGNGLIDLGAIPGGEGCADLYINGTCLFEDYLSSTDTEMQGYFEGCWFHPVSISMDGRTYTDFYPDGAPDRELVTISTVNTLGYHYEPGSPFVLDGREYENAAALLEQNIESHFGLFSAVVTRQTDTEYGGTAEVAVWCNPVKYAVVRLWPVYLVTTVLMIILLVELLQGVRKHLAEPLSVINRAFAANRVELSDFARSPLEELQTLGSNFETCQQARHQAVNKSVQLQAALDYTKNAEENRRNMVSAIAHELKTPLAVIHSYAEGLQTGIAAQKQEKYLAVIQEETEKLDALVLEMLELSRLEAGKVTLRTDQFSLQAMTESVFQRLALAAEGKQLQIDLQFGRDFTVTADEARIDQVITNFATNAIKYTPAGGGIRVRVQRKPYEGVARFIIENDSPPLSQETLSQIWDSFYRADPARSSGGTGLGLAIAKNIIKLHQGTCAVRNTQTGVEFSFQIPL